MGLIFDYLFEHRVKPSDIQQCMEAIPLTTGMHNLLTNLPPHCESIIISDSNSVLIDYILTAKSLKDCFKSVFTNPAKFSDEGKLTLAPYHWQDWCEFSTKNLCKGHILESFIADRKTSGVNFTRIVYVGDGKNDLCPALRLREQDFIFPRIGYRLQKELQDLQSDKDCCPLKAKVLPWNDAREISSVI